MVRFRWRLRLVRGGGEEKTGKFSVLDLTNAESVLYFILMLRLAEGGEPGAVAGRC